MNKILNVILAALLGFIISCIAVIGCYMLAYVYRTWDSVGLVLVFGTLVFSIIFYQSLNKAEL